MADRRPIVTPGRLAELVDTDRAIVSGIVRVLAGDMTFEDLITGVRTLNQLANPSSTAADTTPLFSWTQSGTNGGSMQVTIGARTPVGNVTGNPGDWYIRDSTTTSTLYVHRGASANNTGWVDVGSSLGGTFGATANTVIRRGADASTGQASLLTVADDGTLTVPGTSASSSQPAASIGHNGGTNKRISLYGRTNTPVGNITHDPAVGQGVCFEDDTGIWAYMGAASGSADWYQFGPPYSIYKFSLSWTDSNNLVVSAGYLTDALGRVHTKTGTTALSSTAGLQAPGSLDTGTMTSSRWYYVWMIRNNVGTYSFVFSLSQTAPTLSHANFTATAYAAVARVGSFRTSTTAANIIEFYQTGLFNQRRYVNNASSTFMYALSGGTSTTQTTIGHSAGGGALPITAIEAGITVDTNGVSAVDISYSTAKTNNPLSRVPISSAYLALRIPCLNGTFTYDNQVGSGSTTIVVADYTEEVPFA